MAFDRMTYIKNYHKEKMKLKTVRYSNDKALRIEAYCQYKNMGYSELVNTLIEREIQKDGWKYKEGELKESEAATAAGQATEARIDPALLAKLLRNPEMVQLLKMLYNMIEEQT